MKSLPIIAASLSATGAVLIGTGAYVRSQEEKPVPVVQTVETEHGTIYTYQATVERVVDGDTVRVHIPSFPAPFNPIAVRVDHINTPEKRHPAPDCEIVLGVKASEYASAVMPDGQTITVVYDDSREDKYGRLLARIVLPDGRDYGQSLIAAGLAKPYDGGKKVEWCTDPIN